MKTVEKIGLKITFEYLNGNDSILELIKQIADKYAVKGYVEREGDTVQIIVSAPVENIQSFSKELGEKMPYSLFMSDATTQAIEGVSDYIIDRFEIRGEINILPQNTGICPSCLEELLSQNSRRYHFPFISCNYCGGHYSYMYEYPFKRKRQYLNFSRCAQNVRMNIKTGKALDMNIL
ncbi:MAG: acylphosphatase [Persephonella sp.]|nr:acylphosphatase [Persephonella sp.]